jgi:hypothetical protein
MAIVVGTDTYLSVIDADVYWSKKNNATWSNASINSKEAALIEATQYIDGAFEFIGRQDIENVLAWPRFDVCITSGNFAGINYDSTTIPPQIENACAELALEALSGLLMPSQDRGGMTKKEKVDVIEVEYSEFAPTQKTYDFVALLLKPLIAGGSNSNKLIRA